MHPKAVEISDQMSGRVVGDVREGRRSACAALLGMTESADASASPRDDMPFVIPSTSRCHPERSEGSAVTSAVPFIGDNLLLLLAQSLNAERHDVADLQPLRFRLHPERDTGRR